MTRLISAVILLSSVCLLFGYANAIHRNVTCETGQYPPPASRILPQAQVNLDLPPYQRWQALGQQYATELKNLMDIVYDIPVIGYEDGAAMLEWVDQEFGPLLERLPQPYQDEIAGLADAANIDVGQLVLGNIFYEVFTVCTSIVAQDSQGNVYHGRNLDFGLFPAYNLTDHDWTMTDLLRPLMVNVEFTQNGKTLFRSVHFIGYVGVLSAMKPGVFSVTVNDRFDKQLDIGLFEWLKGLTPKAQFIGFLLRDQMQTATSFASAVATLNSTQLISPVYFIASGPQPGDGAVISREKTYSVNLWPLSQQLNAGSFYVLQTNYDHWTQPPWFDDRVDPGMQCMNETGQANINFKTLYNVLDTKPVRNQLTTYTVLMDVKTGAFEVYMQYCAPPCVPW